MKQKGILAMVLAVAVALFVSGSHSGYALAAGNAQESNRAVQAVLDNLSEALLAYDALIMIKEEMLQSVQGFVDTPGDDTLAAAYEALRAAAESANTLPIPENKFLHAPEDLLNAGISIVDFDTIIVTVAQDRADLFSTIEMLLSQMEMASATYDETVFGALVSMVKTEQIFARNTAKIHYLGINYILLSVDALAVDAYRQDVLGVLDGYVLFALPWETDGSIIEQKASLLFIQMEDALTEMASQIGKMENEMVSPP